MNVSHELQVCVTHWRIYRAWRAEPFAVFAFAICPIEDGEEHDVRNFAAIDEPWPLTNAEGIHETD